MAARAPEHEATPEPPPVVHIGVGDLGLPRWSHRLIVVAAVVTLPASVLQFRHDTQAVYDIALAVNWATWALFAVVWVWAAVEARPLRPWLRHHWLDVAVVLLSSPLFPLPMQLLRGLWLVRLIRTSGLSRRIFSGQSVRFTIGMLVLAVAGGGSLFAELEHRNIGEGVYWAMTTVTTVGYGDITPDSSATRVLAVVVMSIGIVSLGFLTAAASERWMLNARNDARRREDAADTVRETAAEDVVLARLAEIAVRLDAIEARLPPPSPSVSP